MLITPFVMREKDIILNVNDMPTTIKMEDHMHPLSLVSQDDDEGNHEEDDDEDEAMKICNVCITPISSPPYYQCGDCKYFIHLICCMLPNTLSSTSQYGECSFSDDKNHKLTLYARDKDRSLHRCDLCGYYTNGMVYKCEECGMSIDVKCASLPTTSKHASHSHSHPNFIMYTIYETEKSEWIKHCCYCANYFGGLFGYICSKDDCEFALDFKCALLPPAVRKPEWDHHPLLLTFDASADHPSDFYCEFCEEEMHPKKPMYHCSHAISLTTLIALPLDLVVTEMSNSGGNLRWIQYTLTTLSLTITSPLRNGATFVTIECMPILDLNVYHVTLLFAYVVVL